MFFKTIRREMEGYVPFEFSLCPSLVDKFKQKTGRTDYVDYFNMPMRNISVEELPRENIEAFLSVIDKSNIS